MNPISSEILGLVIILAYIVLCSVFILSPKQGWNFMDTVDKAFMWGSCISIIGYSLDTAAYVTMA